MFVASSLMPVMPPPPQPIATVAKRPELLAAAVKAPPLRWEYDTYVESVNDNAIQSAYITQDQKSVHVVFIDGSQRDMLLPNGYDHIGFMMQHNIQLQVTKSVGPSAFSIVDIMLFAVQAIVLSRLIFIDANKKKADQDAMNKSGQIITSMFIDDTISDAKQSLNNKLLMAMSGTIAQDLVSGVIRNTTGTNGDIVHIARMTYELIASYGIIDLQTTDEIDKFIRNCYRQSRYIVKRNFIYICRLKEYLLTHDNAPSLGNLMEIVDGISCKLNKNKITNI